MRYPLHGLCLATVLAFSIVGPGALIAAGDDAPPRTTRADRPTRTILRPTDIPELDRAVSARQSDRPVCLLVSGIFSDAPDGTFDALVAALESQCEVHRFGGDPAHPYDTSGSLDQNADSLTAEIKELAKTHPKIDIVAHSMGGAVVDDAFRRGLSVNDKVGSYIALASPHNGSTEAKLSEPMLAATDAMDATPELRAITAGIGLDIASSAVSDLAHLRAGPPPAGINRLDLRMGTDLTVTAPDAWTPNVTSRTLLPTTAASIEGHGGITTDPHALALITSTIANGRPPARDWREFVLEAAASAVSAIVEKGAPTLYRLAAVGLVACAVALAMRRRRWTLAWHP